MSRATDETRPLVDEASLLAVEDAQSYFQRVQALSQATEAVVIAKVVAEGQVQLLPVLAIAQATEAAAAVTSAAAAAAALAVAASFG